MDKDQIVCKLKAAIEENNLPQFEQECLEKIAHIDTYIKVSLSKIVRAYIDIETLQEQLYGVPRFIDWSD
jgi:hypothetical protein